MLRVGFPGLGVRCASVCVGSPGSSHSAETCTSWLTWHLQEMDGWTHDLKYQQTHSFSFICDEFVWFFVVKLGKASLQSPRRWILSPRTLCFILCVSARLPPGLGNKVKPQKGFIADPATQARPNWLIYLFIFPSRRGNLSLSQGGANLPPASSLYWRKKKTQRSANLVSLASVAVAKSWTDLMSSSLQL